MRKAIALLVAFLIIILCGCSKEKTEVSDYQYIYSGIVKDWNKQATNGCKRESLLGFGEYLYNSQLVLFPRETPSTLKEFYVRWVPGVDTDGYAIYFTCQLSEDNYQNFAAGLKNFKIVNGQDVLEPLYNDSNFSLPAYILQWKDIGEKWELFEYVMLDEENRTAVFVYTMSELDSIEEHSSYEITPNELYLLDEDFSIYRDFENCTYDISFLDYLN